MKIIDYSELLQLNIKAITASNRDRGCYALYGENRLFIVDIITRKTTEIAYLPNIKTVFGKPENEMLNGKELEISIAFHDPYVCVAERFGLNAALINIDTGIVREFQREDYCSEVSSYSIGFIERDNNVLLICQTQWNRLDIFNAETGENLTEREVFIRKTDRRTENGNPEYEQKNYLDFFHSCLHVSPDGKHFLSNGWLWHPFGQILMFETSEFLRIFELGCIDTDCGSPYNWDRPCAFIDNDIFVIALDDRKKVGFWDEDVLQDYEYFQLAFFRTDAEAIVCEGDYRIIRPFRKSKCSVFTPGREGEIKGLLSYDKSAGYLVALTHDKGAFAVSLDGEILENLVDVTSVHSDAFSESALEIDWNYSTEYHTFYTWREQVGIIEKGFSK